MDANSFYLIFQTTIRERTLFNNIYLDVLNCFEYSNLYKGKGSQDLVF